MKVDFSAFRLCWLLTFLDLIVYRIFDGLVIFAKVVTETFYIAVNWDFRCTLTSGLAISFWIYLRNKQCENSTLSQVKLQLTYVSFGKSVYRLLQRHRCRRATCSGRLQCADMELLSLLRFSFHDVFMTDSFMTHRVPQASFFFCFWTIYMGLSCTSL